MTKHDDLPKVRMVYIGRTEGDQGKIAYRWGEFKPLQNDGREWDGLWDDEPEETPSVYVMKSHNGRNIVGYNPRPGTVYDFPDAGNGSLYTGISAVQVGTWSNDDDRVKWQAIDTAFADARAQAKGLKEERLEDVLAKNLDPIHDAYMSATPKQRQAILARVIWYITRR